MKTKILLAAAVIGAATLSANAGVRFGFSIGIPAPVVVVAAPPVVVAAPVAVVAGCPGPGYVWAPGYWSVVGYSRVWVAGGWHYGPGPRGYVHGGGWHRR